MTSRLSRRRHYLPRSYWVDPASISLPSIPYTTGTYAQVYCGERDGQSVAVKVMRTSNQENPLKLKRVGGGGVTRGNQLTGWNAAFLQGGNLVETRVVSICPQVLRRVLPQ